MKKVKIELRPYTALGILAFLREFINDSNKEDEQFAAIHESVKEYEDEVIKMISDDHLEDARLENEINYLTGRQPKKEK